MHRRAAAALRAAVLVRVALEHDARDACVEIVDEAAHEPAAVLAAEDLPAHAPEIADRHLDAGRAVEQVEQAGVGLTVGCSERLHEEDLVVGPAVDRGAGQHAPQRAVVLQHLEERRAVDLSVAALGPRLALDLGHDVLGIDRQRLARGAISAEDLELGDEERAGLATVIGEHLEHDRRRLDGLAERPGFVPYPERDLPPRGRWRGLSDQILP